VKKKKIREATWDEKKKSLVHKTYFLNRGAISSGPG